MVVCIVCFGRRAGAEPHPGGAAVRGGGAVRPAGAGAESAAAGAESAVSQRRGRTGTGGARCHRRRCEARADRDWAETVRELEQRPTWRQLEGELVQKAGRE
eukprot:4031881-Pyramimonas_sp.AAC.2